MQTTRLSKEKKKKKIARQLKKIVNVRTKLYEFV